MSSETSSPPAETRRVLVDGHVHFHDGYDGARFFDGAAANLRRGASHLGITSDWRGCLLFTESEGVHAFRTFRDTGAIGAWSVETGADEHSFTARRDGAPDLVVIAGRQIVVADKLEILAIGRDLGIADGSGFAETAVEVEAAGALPVIPWGFGKWWFKRGRIVRKFIDEPPVAKFLLGDNGGRLRLLPRPPLFRFAEERGVQVLPGSDPLPFASQEQSAGGHGLSLEVPQKTEDPTESVLAALRALDAPAPTFGNLESPGRFFQSQVAMQLRKRRRA